MRDSNGGIVTGWLTRVVILLAVIGFVAFEAGAVITAKVGVDATADTAAREAALIGSRNEKEARDIAAAKAAEGDAVLISFGFSGDHKTVTVTLERRAKTVVIHRIAWLKRFSVERSTHSATVGP